MNKPVELKGSCPFCSFKDGVTLNKRKFKHLPANGNKIMVGYWWYYKCPSCKEAFTTADSDDISLNTLKHNSL